MLKATLTLPPLKTKKVWAGIYGGHYDQIVFFSHKPKLARKGDWRGDTPNGLYDPGDDRNRNSIVGDIGLQQFQQLFPDCDLNPYLKENGYPKHTEIVEVFQIELTAMWDDDGTLSSISFQQDYR